MRLYLIATSTIVIGLHDPAVADPERQAEVTARSAEVRPFKLSATTQVFTKTRTGGLQKVVAKDPKNSEQIQLIRQQLSDLAGRFRRGDFSAPADIHGADVPGLAKLKAAAPGQISIHYLQLANGGQIEYSTRDPALVTAIHDWFDTQVSDRGREAVEGHDQHP